MGDRGNVLLRQLDRYVGIPLVFLAGLTVRKKSMPEKMGTVGILATAAIGDTLLMSAVLKDLFAAHRNTDFTIYCGATNRGTFEMALPGTTLVPIPVNNPLAAVREIRKKRFDLFIDFGPWPRLNSLLTYFSRSACTIGFQSIGQYRHYVYNIPVEHRNDCHELDNQRRLLIPLGIESHSLPTLGKAEPDRENPYVVVHMFPSGYMARYKEWSDSRWVKLIDGLTDKGWPVVLTGGPADLMPCERIASSCRKEELIDIRAGKTNLCQAGELLRKASLVISVNTGIMHMAAAYGQKLIALHGPTSVRRWGPVCEGAVNFTASTSSAGCLHLGFEYDIKDDRSLDTIDPELVLEKALALLGNLSVE